MFAVSFEFARIVMISNQFHNESSLQHEEPSQTWLRLKRHDALLKRNCWGLGVGVCDVVIHGLSLFIDLWTHSQTISVLDVLKTRNAQG